MHYRSYADLARLVFDNLHRVPGDVDLVVSVSHTGTFAASILASGLDLPAVDIDCVVGGHPFRTTQVGPIRTGPGSITGCRHALVIDDSVHTGRNFADARDMIVASGRPLKVTYAAVYASPDSTHHVDLHFEICPCPRVFEWKFLHHETLATACLDIDGVLCLDPTPEQNDDGPHYLQFLREARPQLQPKHPVHHLVTSRLERYRPETEDWLRRRNIRFGRLSMLDLPDAATRRGLNAHAAFKGSVYRNDDQAQVFLESEPHQAPQIAALSGKPVICVGDRRLYLPSGAAETRPSLLNVRRNRLSGMPRFQAAIRRLIRGPNGPAPASQRT